MKTSISSVICSPAISSSEQLMIEGWVSYDADRDCYVACYNLMLAELLVV